ncbi:MAG: hypothetical protein WCW26_00480 [Candidatus Buchananbacteria bacterium]
MEEFILNWQTLIGSALGPFLLGVGFWVKGIIKAREEYKELLRRVEISTTQSLDSIYKMYQQLEQVIGRIKNLAKSVRAITDNKTFCLDRANFPPVREVYSDKEAPYFKIKSYYLHNKLLWIDAGIKEVNEINANFKNDFNDLMRQNELLVVLNQKNPNPDPSAQRTAYANNLENFASVVEEYINNHILKGIEIIAQIKIYNGHLRKGCGFWFRWKHEGFSFNFLCKRIELKKVVNDIESLDAIDAAIKKEVDLLIQQIEKRAKNLSSQT